ncbi:MAG TPA: hypothetical protein VIU82_13955 [Bosea sp. (in: a-proteobacteria)]
MTTKKQIKWLLDQLVARNDDLFPIGPYVVLRPLRHVIRTISIDRTSSADYPQFLWSIGHTFRPFTSLQGLNLERIFIARGAPRHWSEPGMADAFIEAAEQRILPMLRRVETITDMFCVHGEPRSFEYDFALYTLPYLMLVQAANGEFDDARAILDEMRHSTRISARWRPHAYDYAVDTLGPLVLADDRAGIAQLLHRWEEENVARLGLEAIYERTPFPIECGMLA